MKDFLKIFGLSVLVYILSWLLVYKTNINQLPIQSEDTLPALFIPITLIKEQTLYVDTYYRMMLEKYPSRDDLDYSKGLTPFYLRKVTEKVSLDTSVEDPVHYVSAFPIISGLLALPVYFLPLQMGMSVSWENLAILGHITGALIVSFSGYILFLLLKKHFNLSQRKSYLLTAVYFFGTINFALISQALWQHGTVQLFCLLGLYYLLNALNNNSTDRNTALFWSGLFFGLAVLSRPTAALSYILFYALIFFAYSKNFRALINSTFYYVLGLVPVAAFFFWYNNTFYLNINNQGYADQLGNSWTGRFPEGFLGVWFSPSKGILVYSPIIIFALVGAYLAIKNRKQSDNFKYLIFAALVLLHTLIIGKWKHWFGGWSFGYRMSSDVIPYMILLMVPYLQSDLFQKTKKLFLFLLILSVLVQIYGIIFYDGMWHAAYDLGTEDTSWLWSIKDSEFLFNIRRILVKFGLLDKACPQCL